jgi:hypothetical protein
MSYQITNHFPLIQISNYLIVHVLILETTSITGFLIFILEKRYVGEFNFRMDIM